MKTHIYRYIAKNTALYSHNYQLQSYPIVIYAKYMLKLIFCIDYNGIELEFIFIKKTIFLRSCLKFKQLLKNIFFLMKIYFKMPKYTTECKYFVDSS